ncbi:MAG: hypothetical protein IPK95_10320 [Cellvibrionales bacterium]|nr:hypothetical protein [Cellvibrionales bacterium]
MTNITASTNQLLYLVYGPDEAYHAEARFSILSALYRGSTDPGFMISVYTDAPLYYEGLPVQVHALPEETLQQWYGPLRYHHRAKLCLLQHAVPLAEKTVFIDTDTFFLRDPALLFDAVDDKTCLADELYDSQLPAVTANDPAVAALLAQFGIDPKKIPVINSGLFGISRSNSDVLDIALALNDVVYPASGRSLTTEQLVLGMAASTRAMLVEDSGVIKHYWSRKQLFRAKAFAFIKRHGNHWDTAAARNDFLRVTPVLPKPPAFVRTLAKLACLQVTRRDRQLLLELLYGRYPYRNPFDRACCDVWQQKAVENYLEKVKPRSAADCRLFDDQLFSNRFAKTLLGSECLENARQYLSQIIAARL